MARSDERKDHQEGNILDLGTPTTTDHIPSRETDEERRRHRMERGADEVMTSTETETPVERGHGVAGADMGISGEGTDFETPEH